MSTVEIIRPRGKDAIDWIAEQQFNFAPALTRGFPAGWSIFTQAPGGKFFCAHDDGRSVSLYFAFYKGGTKLAVIESDEATAMEFFPDANPLLEAEAGKLYAVAF